MSKSPIADFYVGRSIFITGASGLMGKVLVEKLLYSCPGVKSIFMLIRSKRGRTPDQRREDIWNLAMFERLRESQPKAINKMIVVSGDVTSEGLGISAEMVRRIIDEVSVVFHCAATLRLEGTLKDAIIMNTTGTKRVLDLARQIKNLAAFVHLSTAFCYCDFEVLEEKVHDCPHKAEDLMRCIEWMDEKTLDLITPNLIHPHPNTYTYSKRLAEGLVRDAYSEINAVIARPSIVAPTWEEPLQGWVDNLNGPVGLMVGAGKGVIRSMHCKGEYHAEVIPLDVAINGLIIIGCKTGSAKVKSDEIPVYNMTVTNEAQRLTWAEVLDKGKDIMRNYPFDGAIWYPDGDIRSSLFIHNLFVFFFHIIPAYFIDFLMLIFRQKRFMVRIQRRISEGLEVLQFFTTREWVFKHDKYAALEKELSTSDKKTFIQDTSFASIDEYMRRIIIGARVYLMKEPLSTLPRARALNYFLYVLHNVAVISFYSYLICTILSWTGFSVILLDLYRTLLPRVIGAFDGKDTSINVMSDGQSM